LIEKKRYILKVQGGNIKTANNKQFFVGIDLGAKSKKTTGLCLLEEEGGFLEPKFCQVIYGQEILKSLKNYLSNTRVIAIDGPLSLGPGKGKMRLYEKFLSTSYFRAEKVSPLPPVLMQEIVEVGEELVAKLSLAGFAKDINLIETFPTIVLAFCGNLDQFVQVIEVKAKIKVKVPQFEVSHQKSAFVCALIAFLHLRNLTNFLGYRDGMLILPSFDFWLPKWQDKFRKAWLAKDYLKYRHLKTDIFSTKNPKSRI